jgi:hypothetical protein
MKRFDTLAGCDVEWPHGVSSYAIGKVQKRSSVPTNPYPVRKAARNAEPALPKAVLLGLQQKAAIINQVIEGHLPLWEAAGRFQLAHQAARVCLESATGVPNNSIDGETVCRTIIGWVYLALSERPEQADRVSDRLEGELRDTLMKNAPVLNPPR